jgi:hypothetical protein
VKGLTVRRDAHRRISSTVYGVLTLGFEVKSRDVVDLGRKAAEDMAQSSHIGKADMRNQDPQTFWVAPS